MTRLPRRYWHEMTHEAFRGLDPATTVAVLPVAAIEQHGPHLPVYVDACINQGVVARAIELAPADLPFTVLPMMPVGKSNEHLAFPGTLTFSAATLTAMWTELGEAVHRAGLKKILFVNSHGGQPQVMEIVCRELRVRLGMVAVSYGWFGGGVPDGLYTDDERRWGIHAGDIETSMMLHLRPDLVQMDKAEDFRPALADMAAAYGMLNRIGPAAVAWQAQDLHPSGAAGNASLATAEKGRLTVDHAARKLVTVIEEVSRLPLDALRQGPLDRD